jgi:general secretion pathway protein A
MYHHHFGLTEAPFSIAVNTRYLFMSNCHRDALAHMTYGVSTGGGFILLTGEVGTGKTTVTRCLQQQLPDTTDIAIILNPALNAVELLASVCDEFKIDYPEGERSLKILTDRLHQFLTDNFAKGRNTVLLIDEAQHLQFEVLEQIRLLTNLETNTKKLLQIILVGQPELRTLLNKPQLRQLAQRITTRYQLKPLTRLETDHYIRHRLHVAGLAEDQTLFPAAVVKRIHKISGGLPRIINAICDRALLGAYAANKTAVTMPILKQAAQEVIGEDEDRAEKSIVLYRRIILGGSVLLFTVIVLWLKEDFTKPITPSPIVENTVETITAEKKPIANDQVSNTEPAAVAEPWFDQQQQALRQLATTLNLSVNDYDCNADAQNNPDNVRCDSLTVESWQDFKSVDRPAVLSLITAEKYKRFAVIVALNSSEATVIFNNQSQTLSLSELGKLWNGEFFFLWQAPTSYTGSIAIGQSSPVVTWLSQQFAALDQQSSLLAEKTFNGALQQRVKIFQANHQLEADGVVGLKTLLALNKTLGLDKSLNDKFDQANSNPNNKES